MRDAPGPRDLVRAVRWSREEWRRIRHRAGLAGVRPSSYVRAAGLAYEPTSVRAPRTSRTRFDEPRSVRRRVRFHPAEWERVERLAAAVNLPPTRFVREAAVGYTLNTRTDAELVRQLARVGNNLNQLARLAHTTGSTEVVAKPLAAAIARLDRLFERLL